MVENMTAVDEVVMDRLAHARVCYTVSNGFICGLVAWCLESTMRGLKDLLIP